VHYASAILAAFTTSGSAISGWALWSEDKEKVFWVSLAATASVLSFLHSALGAPAKIKEEEQRRQQFSALHDLNSEKSRPCFKTRAVKSQSIKCDSRTAPSALSAGQLFWQRRFKFVQRAFSLREIALEPQSFTKFSGGFRWFTKPRQHIAQFQMNLGIIRRKR
jgi:hypothetical protein